MGAANIKKIKFLSRKKLKKKLDINFKTNNIFFIYHPETLEKNYGINGLINSLDVLSEFKNLNIFISSTNADSQYKKFHMIINKFAKLNKNFKILNTLKHEEYLSLLRHMDGIIGNSSSGILEAPSLKIPTIWIPHSYKECSQHAPNEHLPIALLEQSLILMTDLYWNLGD